MAHQLVTGKGLMLDHISAVVDKFDGSIGKIEEHKISFVFPTADHKHNCREQIQNTCNGVHVKNQDSLKLTVELC